MQVEFTGKQTVYNGRTYRAGEKLQVSDDRAKDLLKAGLAKEAGKKEAPAKSG